MFDRVINLRGRGARGENVGATARRLGAWGVVPTDSDMAVLNKFANYAITQNPGFQSTVPGPAGPTFLSLADFKAAPASNRKQSLIAPGLPPAEYFFVYQDFSATPASRLDSDVIKANSVPLTDGAWVRQQAGGVSFLRSAANAVIRTVFAKLSETVSAADFGAVLDGVTDDSAAIQKCVDYCLSFPRAKTMKVTGPAYLGSPIIIDRAVDSTPSEFRIIGEGEGAGFKTGESIIMFETTLFGPNDPGSEFVTFEGIQFEATTASIDTLVISHNFLRIKFINCYFGKIKVVFSPHYLQSWYFLQCNFRFWSGTTVKSTTNLFDCDFKGCIWEFGEDGIESVMTGGYSLRIIGNLFEGSRRFCKFAGGNATVIIGNYTEGNSEPDYTFTDIELFGASRGVVFHGNQMTNFHGEYNVNLGDVRGFSSAGNYCNDKMFNLASTRFARVRSVGDHAETSLFSDPAQSNIVLPDGVVTMTEDVIATTGGRSSATKLNGTFNVVGTVPSDFSGVQLSESSSMSDGNIARLQYVFNSGAHILRVYSSQDDLTNFATNLSWDLSPGTGGTFVIFGQGKIRRLT